jgi:hypothetical protein
VAGVPAPVTPLAEPVPSAPVRGADDVVVVGAPRSGTSMVAQLLASGGIAFGDHLLPASRANPRGFLEDVRVTELDDELMAPHVVGTGEIPVPEARLAWVGVPRPDAVISADAAQRERMGALVAGDGARGLKDPRFVWTLDAWRAVLRPGTSFVAIVRHPAEVAASLRTMWETETDRGYYGDLELTVEHGLRLWEAANRRLLSHLDHGRWLVLDHASLVAGAGGVAALAGFTGRRLDGDGVDPALRRSSRTVAVPPAAEELYRRLCRRARRDEERWRDGGR